MLESLWKTHWIDSRQFFDEGIHFYESAEWEFARELFQKAIDACRTNGFAYQYLGFLSVHGDDQAQALRYFELAAKCAPNDHHKAIAQHHLSRAWHASGNETAALDHIRLAIALAPEDLPYRLELVRALMRAGLKQDAIRELRWLILTELKYWTAAAIDRTLDPMREDVTELLRQLRDEARAMAEKILAEFRETVRLIDSFPQPLPFVFSRTRNWQRSVEESMKSMRAKETIFEYRIIIGTIPNSHRALIEEILGGYRRWISDSQQKLADSASSNRADVAAIRAQIPQLTRDSQQVASDLSAQEAQILREKKEKGDGYSLALGCTGCLAVPGILIWSGILLEFFAIKRSTGVMDTVGKLILFCPLVSLLPILIAGRSVTFHAKRRSMITAAHEKQLEIGSKMETVEPAAREAEQRNTELLQSRESEFNALRAIYQNTIEVLEQRLAIAKSH